MICSPVGLGCAWSAIAPEGVVGAIRTGFEEAHSGPALVVMADLSDDLTIVPKLLARYQQGYRIVCPSRYAPGGSQLGGPLLKRTLSRLAGLILFTAIRFPTRDVTNNFRLYDADLVHQLGVESVGGFELALELTAKSFRRGLPIAEVPTTWRDRTAGESRFQLRRWLPRHLYWFGYALACGPRGRAPLSRWRDKSVRSEEPRSIQTGLFPECPTSSHSTYHEIEKR